MDLAEVFRTEWPRLVAVLVRDFGDIQLAEDCAQEAFVQASKRWRTIDDVPDRPGAWLTTTGRRKALDIVRRSSSYEDKLAELEVRARRGPRGSGGSELLDEQLALLLGCCHPALNLEAQVALTLRLVAGLTTEQIARGFLVDTTTMSKRITRAKAKIRQAGIPFRAVDQDTLRERLDAVQQVIYLIFTEGHASGSTEGFVRGDLCDEAAWLSSLLAKLVAEDTEAHGLHALILLTDARRSTRVDENGVPVLLEDQDRSLWDRDKIAVGLGSLSAARQTGSLGSIGLQALIASFHATAPTFAATDWPRIVRTYDLLLRLTNSDVIALNRAVAISYARSPEDGLAAIDALGDSLDGYLYLHSARAELQRRLGQHREARESYDAALACQPSLAERSFLESRLSSLPASK